MEEDKLLSKSTVRQRVTSCFLAKNPSHTFTRGLVLGSLIPICMVQYVAYIQLSASVTLGELPWYITDVVIVSVAAVEFLVAPLMGWLGYRRRRTMILVWLLMLMVSALLLFAVQPGDGPQGTEFCNGSGVIIAPGTITAAAIRVVILVVIAVVSSLALVAVWSHGLAFMDEHKQEGMSMHFGILVSARVIVYIMVPRMFHPTMKLWAMLLGIVLPMLIPLIQLLKMPEEAPPADGGVKTPLEGRGFLLSLGRVLSNGVAMAQMVAMGLMTAALWGFGRHERDITKVLYNLEYTANWMDMYADILRFHFVILIIVYVAGKFSKPVVEAFSRLSAAKLATIMSFMVIPLYIVLSTVFRCPLGYISGLEGGNYTQPECSVTCGCSPPFSEFSPVCVVDTMTTFVSPCHAGCTGTEEFSGIRYLTNCTCGGFARRATFGACSAVSCRTAFELHKMVYLFVIIFTLMVLQAQGVSILRAVDPRDRSLALGIGSGLVTLLTFVVGHLAFFGIRASTCAWFEGGRCQLQGPLFPYLVSAVSAILVLVSFAISAVIWFRLHRQTPPAVERSNDVELIHNT